MSRDDGAPAASVVASGGLSWTSIGAPRVLSQLAKAVMAIGALSSMMATQHTPLVMLLGTMSIVLGTLGFIASYIVSLSHTVFPGALEVHADHLAIQTAAKRVVVPNRKIRSAMVVERWVFEALMATVEIELVNGDILVAQLPDPRSAGAIVNALGFGAGGARVHTTLAKPTRRLLHPLAGVGSLVAAILGLTAAADRIRAGGVNEDLATLIVLTYPIVALGLYAVAKRLMRAPQITAGDDGVLVQRRLGTRFIPRRDIASVGVGFGSMYIETRTGERVRVDGLLLDLARRNAIARVIDERAGPSAAAVDRFAHYERGGRALPEWRAHLGRAMNETSYRVNAATVEEAAAVLRSAQATAEQRVGAALALRVAGHPKERILVAADAAVDDRVREALEAVVESDHDEPIEKALRRLP